MPSPSLDRQNAPGPGNDPRRPRPPRRPWRPAVSFTASVLAVLIMVAGLSGHIWAVVAALALPMVLLAFGWVPLLRLPSPRSTTTVQLLSAVIILVPGVLAPSATLAWLPAAVALAMLVTFLHQLNRRDARPRLVESVSASASGVALLSSAVCMLPAASSAHGRAALVAVAAATAVSSLADVGLGRTPRSLVALLCACSAVVLGAVVAVAAVVLMDRPELSLLAAAAAGAVAAASSYALRQVQSVLPSLWGRRAQFASAASSVLCTGAVAYALALFTHAPLR
ncbi:hypothetical protein [Gephyromycinifex aptenodytis]|uniref:hypothetical protein n=1 Tax=Gephyromycinifex aptenodytis TaxID=2716227 RepID=UPI0014471D9B|nr:hypothetical protein [Gephyromycinifex aptenodytis]